MTEIRRFIIEDGACVDDEPQLFNNLDAGENQGSFIERAQLICQECPALIACKRQLGARALDFKNAGIEQTVIAGQAIEFPQLPNQPNSLHNTQPQPKEKQPQFIAGYYPDGRAIRVVRLPHEIVQDFFAAASANDKLNSIRTHVRRNNRRDWIRSSTSEISERLVGTVDDNNRDREDMSQNDKMAAFKRIAHVYSRFCLNANTEPDTHTLNQLIDQYITDIVAVKSLGLSQKTESIVLNYSPEECTSMISYYRSLGVNNNEIRCAFRRSTDASHTLDRFCQWLPDALEKYTDDELLPAAIVRSKVFSASFYPDRGRVDVQISEYQKTAGQLSVLIEEARLVPPHMISTFTKWAARDNSDPNAAFVKLQDKIQTLHELSDNYNIPESLLYQFALRYGNDMEGKVKRYKDAVSLLRRTYSSNPRITISDMQHFALSYSNPLAAAQSYFKRLEELDQNFGPDEIDSISARWLAMRYKTNVQAAAHKFVELYKDVNYQIDTTGGVDVEDWATRKAVIRFMECKSDQLKKAVGLACWLTKTKRHAMRSLDATIGDTGKMTLSETVPDRNPQPQEVIISHEEQAIRREQIISVIKQLPQHDQAVLLNAFDLTDLADSLGLSDYIETDYSDEPIEPDMAHVERILQNIQILNAPNAA